MSPPVSAKGAKAERPVELVDAICWAAHTAFNLDQPPSSAEARHFLRHLNSNGHTTTPTRKDTP